MAYRPLALSVPGLFQRTVPQHVKTHKERSICPTGAERCIERKFLLAAALYTARSRPPIHRADARTPVAVDTRRNRRHVGAAVENTIHGVPPRPDGLPDAPVHALPFASSVLWIQWTTVVIFLGIMLLVDLMFLHDSAFVFDPDLVNWRRRTERATTPMHGLQISS